MKIYTHWVYDPDEELHTKSFFDTKAEQEAAATRARNEGKQVVGEIGWHVEPTAKDVANFCRRHLRLRKYMDYPEDDEPAADSMEDDLGDLM